MSAASPNKVVVPVDYSPEALEAVKTALEIVPGRESVEIVQVLPDLAALEPGIRWDVANQANRRQQAEQTLRNHLQQIACQDLKITIVFGDPGEQIALFAADLKADLIVIPSQGRKGIARLLIGSVAERVMRLAQCPVLVLRW